MINIHCLKSFMLLVIICLGISFIGFSQEDDDEDEDYMETEKTDSSYRWRFFKIARVLRQGSRVTLELDLKEKGNLFSKPDSLRNRYASRINDSLRYPLSSQWADTIEIFPVADATIKKANKIVVRTQKSEVTERLSSYTIRYEVLADQLPAYIAPGDFIPLKYYEKPDSGLMLYRLEDYDITLLNTSNEAFDFGYELNNASVEMLYIKLLILDLQSYADWLKTKNMNPKLSGGKVDGKPLIEVIEATTEDQVYRYLNFMLSYPRSYMGTKYKVLETFATWLTNNEPAGTLKKLTIENEWQRLVKLAPIGADYMSNTLNGIPVPVTKAAWLSAFPFYTEEASESEEKNSQPDHYDYNAANHLAYFYNKRFVRIYISHRFLLPENIFSLDKSKIETLLGKPHKIITDQESGNQSYCYRRPNGTLRIHFGMPLGDDLGVLLIDMYADKLEDIKSFD